MLGATSFHCSQCNFKGNLLSKGFLSFKVTDRQGMHSSGENSDANKGAR